MPSTSEIRVNQALQLRFPAWAATNRPVSPSRGNEDVESASETAVPEYSEFLLSTADWVLRPKGLQALYEILTQEFTTSTMTYQVEQAVFKVKCPYGLDTTFMARFHEVFKQIVESDLHVPSQSDQGEAGLQKAMPFHFWRDIGYTEEELNAFELFKAKREIFESTSKEKWELPQDIEPQNATIHDLLPGGSISEIEKVAGVALDVVDGGLVAWIGADSEDKISLVKKKLDTLVKYFTMERVGKSEHLFYTEETRNWMGELRFWGQVDNPLMSSFFLDRDRPLPRYSKLLERGVIVRMSPWDHQKKAYVSVPQRNIIPASTGETARHPFRAFQKWVYRGKTKPERRAFVPAQPHAATQEATSQENSDEGRIRHETNLRHVSSWVERLPEPQSMSQVNLNRRLLDCLDEISDIPDLRIGSETNNKKTPKITRPGRLDNEGTVSAGNNPDATTSEEAGQTLIGTLEGKASENDLPEFDTLKSQSSIRELENAFVIGEENGTQTLSGSPPTAIAKSNGKSELFPAASSTRELDDSTPQETLVDLGPQTSCTAPPKDKDPPSDKPHGPHDGGHTSGGTVPPSQPVTRMTGGGSEDPFLSLYLGVRPSLKTRNYSPGNIHASATAVGTRVPSSAGHNGMLIDITIAEDEKESREFHNTMRQKTSSRAQGVTDEFTKPSTPGPALSQDSASKPKPLGPSTPKYRGPSHCAEMFGGRQDPDPRLLTDINEKLVRVMEPLRVWRGRLSLRVDLGRFCLMQIGPAHVQLPGPNATVQRHEPSTLKQALDTHHIGPKSLLFTRILSTEGGDANFIAHLKEAEGPAEGARMWRPDLSGRRVVYEIPCRARTANGETFGFIIEVDGDDFSYNVRHVDNNPIQLFVHCVKRSWDFQLTLSATPNAEKIRDTFAKDLVDSLRITSQRSGVPRLEFVAREAYQVDIGIVRIRHIATYRRKAECAPYLDFHDDVRRWDGLALSEVHDTDGYMEPQGDGTIKYFAGRSSGLPDNGQPPTWIEASIHSNMVAEAFRENESLEVGDEAKWSAEELSESGVLDDLIRTATQTVKQMDGVGYWSNNRQNSLTHGLPPRSDREASRLHRSSGAYKEVYW
ncbi:hypothetical protein DL764_010244 [Monosporascus ibericus]|uniref:Uncharacterized protein n=1 Tax=Monosporascus ibericus TaxID=155417 RepID=A0A4Q4ST22_9PEZI|nr:hypothetical protein DL764_010244 [Monosporascus ibericus]